MSYFRELYNNRNFIKAIIYKNLVGKYKSSIFGPSWNFLMPAIMMAVYYIVFNQIRTNPIPEYWVYLASGIFCFNFMMGNITSSPGVITSGAGMIKKMYFPREILVISHVVSGFIIMVIGYGIVLVCMIMFGQKIGASLIFLPLFLLLNLLFVYGYALLFSAITVYARDFQYLINTISMMFFFLTPMYFLVDSTDGLLNILVRLNPLTYFVEACHEILYRGHVPDVNLLFVCIFLTALSMIVGIVVFGKLKKGFAERL